MADWWSRWLKLVGARVVGKTRGHQRRNVCVELLELRQLLSVSPLVAVDDAFAINAVADITITEFDVLQNDVTVDSAVNLASVVITSGPSHGVASVTEKRFFSDGDELSYATYESYDDNDSPLGDGHASALTGVVDDYGHLKLRVGDFWDGFILGNGAVPHRSLFDTGDYALFIRLGTSDFGNFDPHVFDFEFHGRVEPAEFESYILRGQVPGTPFMAWIDNTVGSGTPDTYLLNLGPYEIHYEPEPGFLGTDVIHYALMDVNGAVSNEATVTLNVVNRPPIADGVTISTHKNASAELPIVEDFLVRDLDGTIDPLSLAVTSGPSHGSAEVRHSEDGSFLVFTPDPDFPGIETFTYTVNDDRGAVSNTATVTVNVINDVPVASDETVSTPADTPLAIDVLANDFDSDGALDASSLTIITDPVHGTATVQQTPSGPVVLYAPAAGYLGPDFFQYTVRDDNGAISNVATVTVNPAPEAADDSGTTTENTPVVIDVLGKVVAIAPDAMLVPSTFLMTSGPQRGTVTFQQTDNGLMATYTPNAGHSPTLVVDDPLDKDDGNYSRGHLSLREAIKLANDDRYTDSFSYTVQDDHGVVSNQATVTIDVSPNPTTITFAPSLVVRHPSGLRLSQVGDTFDGNTALAITSNISIVGPSARTRVTLSGPGSSGDLRLFRVATGGELTLKNLKLVNGATDASGGALEVEAGAAATLLNCVLANNFAFDMGGAIYNFGTVTLSGCQISNNNAGQGGAISNFGTITVTESTLSGNHAEFGGGLYNELGTVTFTNTTLSQNSATKRGGGFFNAATVLFTGGSLTNNSAPEGGGFYNVGSVTLTDSTVVGNRADKGGGFANGAGVPVEGPFTEVSGTVILTRTTLSNNKAKQGGGFHNVGTVSATESKVLNNQATQGGGIFNTEFGGPGLSSVTLVGSVIAGNRAAEGAGLYVDLGGVTLVGATVSENSATSNGGGILNNSALTLTNSTVGGNSARIGGGLYNGFGSLTISSSTISNNSAQSGGGLFNDVGLVTLTSTIVASNRRAPNANDIAGKTPVDAAGSWNNLIGAGGSGGLVSGVHGNLVGFDPLLARLGDYGGAVQTFALLPGSLAIDAGTGEGPDARGVEPVGQRDIGAFESHGFTVTVRSGSRQSTPHDRKFAKPLQATVAAVSPNEPVVGGVVTFAAPNSGASVRPSVTSASIGLNRTATAKVTANNLAGTYFVTATAAGVTTPAVFRLTNIGSGPPAQGASVQRTNPQTSASLPAVTATPATSSPNSLDWSAGYATLPADTTEYRLTASHQLQKRTPSSRWVVVAEGVQKFEKGRNGDLYLLNDQQELKRVQFGDSWTTLKTRVRTFEMAANGTLYVLDHLHRVWMFASLDRYYVLPATAPDFAFDPPSPGEVMRLANDAPSNRPVISRTGEQNFYTETLGFPLQRELDEALQTVGQDASAVDLPENAENSVSPLVEFTNVRVVVEPIFDSVEAPRNYPGVGLAQMHHAWYKATIYSDTLVGDSQRILFIDHDHLNLVSSLGNGQSGSHPSVVMANAGSGIIDGDTSANQHTVSHVVGTGIRESFAPSLIKGPDGTLYRMGIVDNGQISLQNEPAPYSLWRLVPGAYWELLPRVLSFSVGPDSTLYILNASHELQSLSHGSSQWVTLDRNVQSFAMAPNGTIYALKTDHLLRQRLSGSQEWRTLDTGVTSFAMLADGTAYELNDRFEFKRLKEGQRGTIVAKGVKQMALVDDALYVLDQRQEFRRLTGRDQWKRLDQGIESFTVATDGTLYSLNTQHTLKRLTGSGQWDEIDSGVVSYQVAPNRDLYVLNDRQELKRLKFGYSWSTLQSGVQTFTIDDYGTVFVFDQLHRVTMYSSRDRYFVLGNASERGPHFAKDPPSPGTIVADLGIGGLGGQTVEFPDALLNDVQYFPLGPNAEAGFFAAHQREGRVSAWNNIRMVVEPIIDRIDSPRFFPNIGLAQVHHEQYKVTVYGSTLVAHPAADPDHQYVNESEIQVIFIDRDHLNIYTPPVAPQPGQGVRAAAAGIPNEPASSSNAAQSVAGTAVQRRRDELSQ